MQDFLSYTIFANSIGQILSAFSIVFVSFLIRKALVHLLLPTIKEMVSYTKDDFDDRLIAALERPIGFFIIALGFEFAFLILNLNITLASFLGLIIKTAFIFLVFWVLYRLTNQYSDFFHLSKKMQHQMGKTVDTIISRTVKFLIVIIGFMSIAQTWGINISAFVASLGLGGLAFALAAKDTAANLFGSLVIFSDKPFRVGDWIKTSDVEGTIEDIGLRSTKVRTFEQSLVNVPNAHLANSSITNWSRMSKRRIKMNIGLTYSTTKEQMESIINDIRIFLRNSEDIHQDTIFIYFNEYNNSSMDIFCYFFTKTTVWGDYLAIREKINLKILEIVNKNNAAFAFPSTSLYIEEDNTKKEKIDDRY